MRGYKVIFVADATASITDAEHNAALLCVRIAFADVRTTEETVALITEAADAASDLVASGTS